MKKVMLSAAVCAMAFSANAEEVIVAETAQTSAFNSIYAGAGIGGSFLKCGDLKANRFMGSFVLGAGKVFSNNVYVGAEVLFDVMKTKKWESDKLEFDSGNKFQTKGFIPQIDVKVGYAFKNDSLVYGKFGCSWSKFSSYDKIDDRTYSKSDASAFVLGLGAEKAFCNNFSTAIEGEYNFGWESGRTRRRGKIHLNKGWSVRALVKYNVKY